MFWNYSYYVAREGLTMCQDGFGNVTPSTIVPAADFVSVGK